MSYVQSVVDRRSLLSVSAVIVLHVAALLVLQTALTHTANTSLARPIEASTSRTLNPRSRHRHRRDFGPFR
jgi:hypothetical protein